MYDQHITCQQRIHRPKGKQTFQQYHQRSAPKEVGTFTRICEPTSLMPIDDPTMSKRFYDQAYFARFYERPMQAAGARAAPSCKCPLRGSMRRQKRNMQENTMFFVEVSRETAFHVEALAAAAKNFRTNGTNKAAATETSIHSRLEMSYLQSRFHHSPCFENLGLRAQYARSSSACAGTRYTMWPIYASRAG